MSDVKFETTVQTLHLLVEDALQHVQTMGFFFFFQHFPQFWALLKALKLQVSVRFITPLDILPGRITPQSRTSVSSRDGVHLGQSRQTWSPLVKKGCG